MGEPVWETPKDWKAGSILQDLFVEGANMDGQLQHAMLPQPTHDELARQQFVHSLKQHIATQISPSNRTL
ncbi:MAG TPA: hypothetical protein V6D16_07370, partial [Candidatus Obscuribacterales bacterium]